MKKFRIPFLVFTVLAAFSLQTCKHCNDPTNPDCANYDPCHDDQPPHAEFGMFERIHNMNCFEEEELDDPLFPIPQGWPVWRKDITFKTEVEDYDSLTWQIGDHNQILRDPEVFLSFGSFLGASMPITLTVYRTSRKGCYNESQSVATSTQTLYFKDRSDENRVKLGEDPDDPRNWQGPWTGEFFCTEKMTGDTFSLFIRQDDEGSYLTITGFNGEVGTIPFGFPLRINWSVSTYSLTFCADFKKTSWELYKWRQQRGIIYYSKDYNTIEMEYWEAPNPTDPNNLPLNPKYDPNNKVKKQLTGIRVE
jgi:hypothetical protein